MCLFVQEVLKVLIEGMSILEQMHLLGFVHGDIKSAKIVIGADGKFKLSFFFLFLFAVVVNSFI
jgi:serine/threonine protein kinase